MQQIATFSSLDLERWSERFFNQENNCVLLMKRDTAEGGQGSQEGADGIFFFSLWRVRSDLCSRLRRRDVGTAEQTSLVQWECEPLHCCSFIYFTFQFSCLSHVLSADTWFLLFFKGDSLYTLYLNVQVLSVPRSESGVH